MSDDTNKPLRDLHEEIGRRIEDPDKGLPYGLICILGTETGAEIHCCSRGPHMRDVEQGLLEMFQRLTGKKTDPDIEHQGEPN